MLEATASEVETRAPGRVSVGRLLGLFVGVLSVGALGVAAANYYLDPLNYSSAQHRKVAEAFEAGKGYAIYDPTIDYRGLRREHIRMMKTTPALMLFSGSRFELVSRDLFPKAPSFYNSFVQRDYFDDVPAFAQLLDSNDRLPKNLLISVRWFSFRPHDQRAEGDQWKMFVPEAAAMARRLNMEPPSEIGNFPYGHYLNLFSVKKLMHQAGLRWKTSETPGPTTERILTDLDILNPDGSMTFSRNHTKSFTPAAARADAAKKAAQDRGKSLNADPQMLAQLKAVIEFLVGKGVNVGILITPQHPGYWEGVAGSEYGRQLVALESELRRLTLAAGAQFVGTFDPTKVSCAEASYRDYIHVGTDCLKKIFANFRLKT